MGVARFKIRLCPPPPRFPGLIGICAVGSCPNVRGEKDRLPGWLSWKGGIGQLLFRTDHCGTSHSVPAVRDATRRPVRNSAISVRGPGQDNCDDVRLGCGASFCWSRKLTVVPKWLCPSSNFQGRTMLRKFPSSGKAPNLMDHLQRAVVTLKVRGRTDAKEIRSLQ
jgi:hypothetical protein